MVLYIVGYILLSFVIASLTFKFDKKIKENFSNTLVYSFFQLMFLWPFILIMVIVIWIWEFITSIIKTYINFLIK
ncbi:putative membrane protein [Proteus phage SJ_PmiM]|nr:putative membrane protein [Proteus phage SJ_PmiM]